MFCIHGRCKNYQTTRVGARIDLLWVLLDHKMFPMASSSDWGFASYRIDSSRYICFFWKWMTWNWTLSFLQNMSIDLWTFELYFSKQHSSCFGFQSKASLLMLNHTKFDVTIFVHIFGSIFTVFQKFFSWDRKEWNPKSICWWLPFFWLGSYPIMQMVIFSRVFINSWLIGLISSEIYFTFLINWQYHLLLGQAVRKGETKCECLEKGKVLDKGGK